MNLKVGDICQVIESDKHTEQSITLKLLPPLGTLVSVLKIRDEGIFPIIVRHERKTYYCKEEELKLIRRSKDE